MHAVFVPTFYLKGARSLIRPVIAVIWKSVYSHLDTLMYRHNRKNEGAMFDIFLDIHANYPLGFERLQDEHPDFFGVHRMAPEFRL